MLKSVFRLALLAVLASSAHAQTNELIPQLERFSPLLGKTWRALVNPDKGHYDVSHWQRALGGKAIRIRHSVNDGIYGGETYVVWNSGEEQIEYFYFTNAGFYTTGTMEFDDQGRMVSREVVTGNPDGFTEVRSTQELLEDGSLRVSTKMLRGEEWVDRGTVVYELAPEAEVVLPD